VYGTRITWRGFAGAVIAIIGVYLTVAVQPELPGSVPVEPPEMPLPFQE
jgi:drug/metabolite transporter (DMT)-like permease